MRTKNYSIAKIESLSKKACPLKMYTDIYDLGKEHLFILIDSEGRHISNDFCRESICGDVFQYLNDSKNPPTYIAITLSDELTEIINVPDGVDDIKFMQDLRKKKKFPHLKKQEDKLHRQVKRLSSTITMLEKNLKFKTHSLSAFRSEKNRIYVNLEYAGKVSVTWRVAQTWALKVDPKWFCASPVLSYYLLCMRESLQKGHNFSSLKNRLMYKLLRVKRPHELFGRSRKTNWAVCGDFDSFHEWYGVDAFERELKTSKVFSLRDRYPNNTIFD